MAPGELTANKSLYNRFMYKLKDVDSAVKDKYREKVKQGDNDD